MFFDKDKNNMCKKYKNIIEILYISSNITNKILKF